jgi:hypothetical protein
MEDEMKKLVIILLMLGFVQPVYSDTGWVENATVLRTLVQDNTYGNCMVYLDKLIADTGLDCPSKWIAFSCDGTFNARDVASKMLDSAMMAFALERKISVRLDDNKKHNGFCTVVRIDVLPK